MALALVCVLGCAHRGTQTARVEERPDPGYRVRAALEPAKDTCRGGFIVRCAWTQTSEDDLRRLRAAGILDPAVPQESARVLRGPAGVTAWTKADRTTTSRQDMWRRLKAHGVGNLAMTADWEWFRGEFCAERERKTLPGYRLGESLESGRAAFDPGIHRQVKNAMVAFTGEWVSDETVRADVVTTLEVVGAGAKDGDSSFACVEIVAAFEMRIGHTAVIEGATEAGPFLVFATVDSATQEIERWRDGHGRVPTMLVRYSWLQTSSEGSRQLRTAGILDPAVAKEPAQVLRGPAGTTAWTKAGRARTASGAGARRLNLDHDSPVFGDWESYRAFISQENEAGRQLPSFPCVGTEESTRHITARRKKWDPKENSTFKPTVALHRITDTIPTVTWALLSGDTLRVNIVLDLEGAGSDGEDGQPSVGFLLVEADFEMRIGHTAVIQCPTKAGPFFAFTTVDWGLP